jgi:uncharacterized membrane protein
MPGAPIFTVVDLSPATGGVATGINRDGFVSISGTGLSAFVFVPAAPNSANGTVVPLTPLISIFGVPAINAQALGLNNLPGSPDVVGWTEIPLPGGGSIQQAVIWFASGLTGGSPVLLLPLAVGGRAQANAINDSRIIVGWSELGPGGNRRAVAWDGNHTTAPPAPLDPLDPSLASEALGINNHGVVVGSSQARDPTGTPVSHAVAWDAASRQLVEDFGTMSSLFPVVLTDLHTQATAINDAGDIVGTGDLANPPIRPRGGFIIPHGGQMQLIPMPPGPNAGAWGLAPNGTAALTIAAVTASGVVDHGATFSMAQGLFDIDSTTGGAPPGGHGLSGGWVMNEARGVNDVGQICGVGSTPFTFKHALLLVP